MEYHVTWKIDIEAESFENATRIAREIQGVPDSIATHFRVECESGEKQEAWTEEKWGQRMSSTSNPACSKWRSMVNACVR
jgi:hypothetical protein